MQTHSRGRQTKQTRDDMDNMSSKDMRLDKQITLFILGHVLIFL